MHAWCKPRSDTLMHPQPIAYARKMRSVFKVLGIYKFGWSSGARKLGDRCKTALMAKCESFCLQACRL